MILKQLTLKGFSPYRTEQTVDFSSYLGKIFLITGDTGAGKTSVFDGIIYALYGKASGALRSEATLRNQSISKKEESFAELSFSVKGVDYNVHRSVRADGKAAKKDDCRLTWADGYIEGRTAVTDEITRLLGFDADAFCRVSMLAQGEFSEFLNMNSADREKVLRRVFGTYLYEQFENKLKERADAGRAACLEAQSGYRAVSGQLRQYIRAEDDGVFDDAERYEELAGLVAARRDSDRDELSAMLKREEELRRQSEKAAADVAAAEALNEKFDSLDRARAECDRLKSLGTGNEAKKLRLALREKAERVKPFAQKAADRAKMLADRRAELAAAEKAAHSAAENLKSAENAARKTDELRAERDLLLSQRPSLDMLAGLYSQRDDLNKQSRKQTGAAEKAAMRLNETEEQLKSAAEEEKQLSERKAAADETARNVPLLKKELEAQKTAESDCAALIKGLKALSAAEAELAERKSEFEHAEAEFKEMEYELNAAQARFYANAAGRLAAQLGKGQPCPVCGSTEHPRLAETVANAPTEDEINALKESVDALMEEKNAADKQRAAAQERLNAAETAAAEKYARVFGVTPEKDALYSAGSAAAARSKEIKAGVKAAEKALAEAEAAAELVPEIEKELAALAEKKERLAEQQRTAQEEISLAKEKCAAVSAQLDDCAKRLAECAESLKMPSGGNVPENEKAARTAAVEWDERAAEIEKIVPELEKRLNDARGALSEANGALGKSRESTAAAEEESAAAEREFVRSALDNGFTGTEAAEKALMSDEEYRSLNDEVNGYAEQVAAANRLFSEISGELSGKERADIAALSERSGALLRELSETTRAAGSLSTLAQTLKTAAEQLSAKHEELCGLNAEFSALCELSSLVAGKGGAAKLSLERYVQGQLFDEVLRRANVRLGELSGGRYSFVRRISNVKASRTSGLDIDVADLNAGPDTVRSVSTLSGGESFLASFALAIGLSDYTMEVNGGRATDVLFVDEGFSALDENTFEQAMEVINGISSENRLIGIVSHVREIREHFTEEIYIRKGENGSSIVQKQPILP
ncbi:MAG: SbcC/MukB-like Walker B domain-containing protein [Oscillospiraceae bacterium]